MVANSATPSSPRDARIRAKTGLAAGRRFFERFPEPPGDDFRDAERELELALRYPALEDQLRVQASLMLSALRISEHEMRCAKPCPTPGELEPIVELLAVAGARPGAPADHLYPYAMTVDKLYDHSHDPRDIDRAIVWLLRAVAHRSVSPADRRRAQISLAVQYANKGAALRAAQRLPGDHAEGAAEFSAAIRQFEEVLAALSGPGRRSDRTRDEDRLDAWLGILETYYQRGGEQAQSEDLDIMATAARSLVAAMTPEYRLRSYALGRCGVLLIQRIMRCVRNPWDQALNAALRLGDPAPIRRALIAVPGFDTDLDLGTGALALAVGLEPTTSRLQPLFTAALCAAHGMSYLAYGDEEALHDFGRRCRIVMGHPSLDPSYRRMCAEFLLIVLERHLHVRGRDLAALHQAAARLRPSGEAALDMMIGLLARFAATDGASLDPALSWTLDLAVSMRAGADLVDAEPVGSDPREHVPSGLGVFSVRTLASVGASIHGRLAVPTGVAVEAVESLLAAPLRDPGQEGAARCVLALAWLTSWLRERDEGLLTRSINQLRDAVRLVEGNRPLHRSMVDFLASVLLDRAWIHGDLADAEAALSLLRGRHQPAGRPSAPTDLNELLTQAGPAALGELLTTRAGVTPPAQAAIGSALLLRGLLSGRSSGPLRIEARGDTSDLEEAAGLLKQVTASLSRQSPHRPDALSDLGLAQLSGGERDHPAGLQRGLRTMREAMESCPAAHPRRMSILLRTAAALAESAHEAYDPRAVDEGIDLLAQSMRAAAPDSFGERSRCLYGLGYTLLVRFGHTRQDADLKAALEALEESRACLEPTPGDPFMVPLLRVLAWAHRQVGTGMNRALSRSVGRSVLHAHIETVLLQGRSRHAVAVARSIGDDALRLATWCLADGADHAAVEALELGRALVLHATTVTADIPALLRAAGWPALAREWGAGPRLDLDAIPGDLRHRVLSALRDGDAERHLVGAPEMAQLAEALRSTRTDALVYLIPASAESDGQALIVRPDGQITKCALPGLTTGPGSVVAGFTAAYRGFRDGPDTGDDGDSSALSRFRDRLGDLCDWAWPAAIGPVLDALRTDAQPAIPLRLAVIPFGILSIVPWSAARLRAPGHVRYACSEAVFTTCASARQLIDAAARPCLPVNSGSAVFIADPSGSLRWAEHEIDGICAALYPDALRLGRPGQPAAGPEEVLACLSASGLNGVRPGVLHFGCHASAGETPEHSRLQLARGDLPVDRILAQAGIRRPGSPGGLVLLAACTSDLTLTDFDEALTLSSAFLAAGAVGVIGSRWEVADLHTSLLMFLLHRHLILNPGASPADALRAAQLWMLDPKREAPPEMPEALAARAHRSSVREPFAWAAFTYHGQ